MPSLSERAQQAWHYITGRKGAYCRVFNLESRDAEAVLMDLARFCRAHETTVTPNDRATAVLEGRREVWLRIQQHLQLDDETLWLLYSGQKPQGD